VTLHGRNIRQMVHDFEEDEYFRVAEKLALGAIFARVAIHDWLCEAKRLRHQGQHQVQSKDNKEETQIQKLANCLAIGA